MPKEDWRTVTHSKFSQYFKLYTNFFNFDIFYLVAHRHYISVFDMSKVSAEKPKGDWVSHYRLDPNL